ncbi:CYFA0S02e07998g1_1 [Cyberlindnera fabianii]|uniref:Biogenesis of lysosome-related organelles complex 1 subunit CNL1 n=1 Tax=Cyberlindnera fabianii TaxID=36022 RepID=A0A061AMR4_CYBFA|nr:CYFA0S02e07998g1_1 [Cyberlindnera fabianii]
MSTPTKSGHQRVLSAESLPSIAASGLSIQSSHDTGHSRLGSESIEEYHRYNNNNDNDNEDYESEDDEEDDDIYEPEAPSTYDEEEDDPLGVKKLALSFDYLMYRICTKMEAIAEKTELAVCEKEAEVNQQLVDAENSMERLRELMKACDDIEMEFAKLEQIGMFVQEFKDRIDSLEKYYKA